MMNNTQFKTMAQSLLRDSTFADFQITCGESSYRVHRAIVSCHSEYFKALFEGSYEESKQRAIDLKEDNPHAVKLMIDYFYGFDYEDDHENITGFSNILELNAAVYVVADKYNVPDLKKLAVKHFVKAAPASALRHEDPKEAIRLTFAGTPSSDRGLRDVVIQYWRHFADVLLDGQGSTMTASIAHEVPDFAAEIMKMVASMSPSRFAATCGRTSYSYGTQMDADSIEKLFATGCKQCNNPMSQHDSLMAIGKQDNWQPFWIKWQDE